MKKILVVEDNPANMKLAAMILEKSGYAVLKAANAEAGIALARVLAVCDGYVAKPLRHREFLAEVARQIDGVTP